MTKRYRTEQEAFWAGTFGDEWTKRCDGDVLVASNIALFSKILTRCPGATSLVEFGANIGLNLRAVRALAPHMDLGAIEINESAVRALQAWGGANHLYHDSILEFRPDRVWDIALIKAVLIHIDPQYLPQVYESLFRASNRYIVLVEYYNPTPVEVTYRGHAGKLFKRNFAGELLDKYPQLRLVDYGFVWHRDRFPQDDTTWFVLEKTAQVAEA